MFFINADAEFAEGKNQNSLRPEDIEKIDHVFTQKLEVPKYSQLVDMTEIKGHDWNLNIRRYVDNTPEPEPEDVRAHLLGGVPKSEVAAKADLLQKFGVEAKVVFQDRDERYCEFNPTLNGKEIIKTLVEADPGVRGTVEAMTKHLAHWWSEAQADFARLAPSAAKKENGKTNGKQLPNVRKTLIASLKQQLVPIGVLDEFQVAGVFVNWWDGIKYDLKTIMINGWSPTLIPDRYLIETFFQEEALEIEKLEAGVGENDSALAEAVEVAQELLEYEAEEDENITAALMRKELITELKDLKVSKSSDANADLKRYQEALDALNESDKTLKEFKRKLEERQFDLAVKLGLKKFGPGEETWDARRLKEQAEKELAAMGPMGKASKGQKKDKGQKEIESKAKRLRGDIVTLERRIEAIERLSDSIGGVITDPEAKDLILRKHHDLVADQLSRYLNAEMWAVLNMFENLWDKYHTSAKQIDATRGTSAATLAGMLQALKYDR